MKNKANLKFLMGTQIITTRSECESVDRIYNKFIIIDNINGAKLWLEHAKPKRLYANNSIIGYKYDRLALLELGELYSSNDFSKYNHLDKNELLSNDSILKEKFMIDIDKIKKKKNQKYYIYYYKVDLIYTHEYLFKVLPYPLEDPLTERSYGSSKEAEFKFLKYEVIEKNTIYNHDDLIKDTDYESDYSEVSCDSDSVIL